MFTAQSVYPFYGPMAVLSTGGVPASGITRVSRSEQHVELTDLRPVKQMHDVLLRNLQVSVSCTAEFCWVRDFSDLQALLRSTASLACAVPR